jgi:hypothetical protein
MGKKEQKMWKTSKIASSKSENQEIFIFMIWFFVMGNFSRGINKTRTFYSCYSFFLNYFWGKYEFYVFL